MAGKELIKAKEDEHVILPQSTTPAADTSDWPLLLKNYDKRTEWNSQPLQKRPVLLTLSQCLSEPDTLLLSPMGASLTCETSRVMVRFQSSGQPDQHSC